MAHFVDGAIGSAFFAEQFGDRHRFCLCTGIMPYALCLLLVWLYMYTRSMYETYGIHGMYTHYKLYTYICEYIVVLVATSYRIGQMELDA